ncbi:MAG: 3-hydroxyacyl-CoA dehydrogenase family protein [Candidatus Spechtbacteria bacterium]|nr:3-hydroxyacyl-CoA dehydrogenase family protein [Candidatus Spechtbacteria bacterium]
MRPVVNHVAVVGAGQMGTRIAQIFCEAGAIVLLYDSDAKVCERAVEKIREFWLKNIQEKNTANMTLEQFAHATRNRVMILNAHLYVASRLDRLAPVDFVVEAVTEDRAIKAQVLSTLDAICKPNTILVTNTSTISIKELAKSVQRHKDKFMGMHFMNPPHVLTFLELIRGPKTSDETANTVFEIARWLNRNPILFASDIPGFSVNGMVMPIINEASLLVERFIKKGMSFEGACEIVNDSFEGRVPTGGEPMGILRLADLIGIDTVVAGLREMMKANRHYKPRGILTDLVVQGRLGRKTKIGFFDYDSGR